jgi:hypothetical protein
MSQRNVRFRTPAQPASGVTPNGITSRVVRTQPDAGAGVVARGTSSLTVRRESTGFGGTLTACRGPSTQLLPKLEHRAEWGVVLFRVHRRSLHCC